MNALLASLQQWLNAENRRRIGQITILDAADGGFELRNIADSDLSIELLQAHKGFEAAIEIAKWDDTRTYRPLKSAPNLARGWRLLLVDLKDLRAALDAFYPAATANYRYWREDKISPVTLRETVSRQTGMYRITGKLTTEQADELVNKTCEPGAGCLRVILWGLEPGQATSLSLPESKRPPDLARHASFPGEIPILCVEMCNILVAEGRKFLKSIPPPEAPPSS